MRWCTFLLLILLVTGDRATGEESVRTFRKEMRQIMGTAFSQDQARAHAIARAKQEAVEEAGTYLESFTVVRNADLERDEIRALSAGILQVEVVHEQLFVEGGTFGILLTLDITVDSTTLQSRVESFKHVGRGLLQELKTLQTQNLELASELNALRKRRRRIVPTETDRAQSSETESPLEEIDEAAVAWFVLARRASASSDSSTVLEGLEYAARALEIEPKFTDALYIRGRLYYLLKDYDSSIADYTRAIDIGSDDVAARNSYFHRAISWSFLFEFEKALADLSKFDKLAPERTANSNRVQALLLSRLGRFKEAIEIYDNLLEREQADPILYSRRASAHNSHGDLEAAIGDYTRALEIDPKYYDALTGRGIAYEKVGKLIQAEADYTKAIQAIPSKESAYYYRGTVRFKLGREEQAIGDLSVAIELLPSDPSAYNNRGWVYHNQGEFNSAILDYTRAIELSQSFPQAVFNRASVFYAASRLDEALKDYLALATEPDKKWRIAGLLGLARTQFALGMYTKVVDSADQVLAETEHNLPTRLSLHIAAEFMRGNAAYRLGEIEKAIQCYDRAIRAVELFVAATLPEEQERVRSTVAAAADDVGMALQQAPDHTGVRELGRRLESLRLLIDAAIQRGESTR